MNVRVCVCLQCILRHTRVLTKRLEECVTDDGVTYYHDPDTGVSTYEYPTVRGYWNTLRKFGVVTGNGTLTGAGVELAGVSRRPTGYEQGWADAVPEGPSEDPDNWELVDGNPPYYYNVTTGESTYMR